MWQCWSMLMSSWWCATCHMQRVAGLLDVQQIFGRAGRPQFQASGEGIIITSHDKLSHYLGMLTSSTPIESTFAKSLVDNLNAEIVLGALIMH